jgi:acetolactate synthase-1/2/3 large subunit
MATGAEVFANTLSDLGIDRVFTLVGDHLNAALAALARKGIQIVHMRHESGVTHAADAWARLMRKPAVALVTGGPGHTNALTGIATAQLACSPLLAISGSRSSLLANRQSFQDIDQVNMARPVVKWAADVTSAKQIAYHLRRAYAEAQSGRQGAVHLTISLDAFLADAGSVSRMDTTAPAHPAPAASDVERAADLLRNASRPVIIAGSGIWWADAGKELLAFVEGTGIPLYTITMARGMISDRHPMCFGFADPALNRAAQRTFQQADLILVLGKRIDYRLALGGTRLIPQGAKVIQVDLHEPEFGMNRAVDLAICADLKTALPALAAELHDLGSDRFREWRGQCASLRSEWQAKLARATADRAEPMHPAALWNEVLTALPEDTLIAWDGGDFTHWGRCIVPARVPGGWLRLGPLGTIGSALPNAIALKMANPNRPVVLFTGDGALGFYIAEMDTLVRYRLPVVILVGNDAGWGLERELQNATGTVDANGSTVACELRATRYDIIMQGFGGAGEHVDRLADIGPALRRGFASGQPYCIDATVRGVRSPFTEWQIEGKSL